MGESQLNLPHALTTLNLSEFCSGISQPETCSKEAGDSTHRRRTSVELQATGRLAVPPMLPVFDQERNAYVDSKVFSR
jgi:hypothetical protein